MEEKILRNSFCRIYDEICKSIVKATLRFRSLITVGKIFPSKVERMKKNNTTLQYLSIDFRKTEKNSSKEEKMQNGIH